MSRAKPRLKSFMLVPMLTGYRPSEKDAVAGMKNKKLRRCFHKFTGEKGALKYYREIKGYFESGDINITIFPDFEFSHKNRARYFKKMSAHMPKRSLIFLDPDTGIQADGKAEKQHLKFSELQEIYNQVDDGSVLMVYQHFYRDRKNPHDFPEYMAALVEKQTKEKPLVISDNSIMFLFLTKDEKLKKNLEKVLNDYRKQYPKSFRK
jgi:competence CoiA-like predicted nuclease